MALSEACICEELRNGVWHINRRPSESSNADMHWVLWLVWGSHDNAQAPYDYNLTSDREDDRFSNPDKWVVNLR